MRFTVIIARLMPLADTQFGRMQLVWLEGQSRQARLSTVYHSIVKLYSHRIGNVSFTAHFLVHG